MPTVVLSPIGTAGQQFFNNNGTVLSGGLLYTYAAGTTTPLTTYTTSSGSSARTNPVVLDSAGRVSGDGVWLLLGYAYKFVLKTSTGTTIGTWDNITGVQSGIQVAATVAALAAITGMSDGARVLVTDWGFYRYSAASTATVNGASVVTAAGGTGRWLLEVDGEEWRPVFNVKQYGAVGDGTTDDTVAVQAAITAAAGYTLLVPNGSYKLSSQITIASSVTIEMDPGAQFTIAVGFTDDQAFEVTSSNVILNNFRLDGTNLPIETVPYDGSIPPNGVGITFTGTSGTRLTGIKVIGGRIIDTPFSAVFAEYLSYPVIQNLATENCASNTAALSPAVITINQSLGPRVVGTTVLTPGMKGITLANCTGGEVSDCYVKDGNSGHAGIFVSVSPGSVVANNRINGGAGIKVERESAGAVITGNTIVSPTGVGILDQGASYVTIIGNTVVNPADDAIQIDTHTTYTLSVQNVAIENNQVVRTSGSPTNLTGGIVLNSSTSPALSVKYITIRGNHIKGAYYGIQMDTSAYGAVYENIAIQGNTLETISNTGMVLLGKYLEVYGNVINGVTTAYGIQFNSQGSTGDITNLSTTVTNVVGVTAWQVGDFIAGTGIASGTTVLAVDTGAATLTLSLAATATASARSITGAANLSIKDIAIIGNVIRSTGSHGIFGLSTLTADAVRICYNTVDTPGAAGTGIILSSSVVTQVDISNNNISGASVNNQINVTGAAGTLTASRTFRVTVSGNYVPGRRIFFGNPTDITAGDVENNQVALITSLPSTTGGRLTATATLNFGSIAAGATAELTIAVTNAVTGDAVMLGPPSTIEAGLMWAGYVSAAGVVTVRLHNTTVGAIDPASATWRATILRV